MSSVMCVRSPFQDSTKSARSPKKNFENYVVKYEQAIMIKQYVFNYDTKVFVKNVKLNNYLLISSLPIVTLQRPVPWMGSTSTFPSTLQVPCRQTLPSTCSFNFILKFGKSALKTNTNQLQFVKCQSCLHSLDVLSVSYCS